MGLRNNPQVQAHYSLWVSELSRNESVVILCDWHIVSNNNKSYFKMALTAPHPWYHWIKQQKKQWDCFWAPRPVKNTDQESGCFSILLQSNRFFKAMFRDIHPNHFGQWSPSQTQPPIAANTAPVPNTMLGPKVGRNFTKTNANTHNVRKLAALVRSIHLHSL